MYPLDKRGIIHKNCFLSLLWRNPFQPSTGKLKVDLDKMRANDR